MPLSDRKMLDSISRMPFIDSAELALILGQAHTTVHRALAGLLADGIVGRVSHGAAHLPSSGMRRRGCPDPQIRDTFGLRARLSGLQRVD